MNGMKAIGEQVRQLRVKSELSQVECCKRLGLRQSQLSQLENGGRKYIDPELIRKIANTFKIQASAILFDTQYDNEKTPTQIEYIELSEPAKMQIQALSDEQRQSLTQAIEQIVALISRA